MRDFLAGALTMGFATAALFFLRFWLRTHDALFLAFCTAFLLFALNQALIGTFEPGADHAAGVYLLRLLGFALIIGAIVLKNTKSRTP